VEAASQAVSIAKEQTSATLKVVRTAAAALDGFTGETSGGGGAGVGKVRDVGATGDGALAGMGDIVDRVFHTQQEKESEQSVKARVMEAAAAEVAAAAKAYSGGTVSALKHAHDALMALSPPPIGQAYSPPQPTAMESDSATTLPGFESIEEGLRLNASPPPFPLPSPPSPPSPPPYEASNTAAAIAEDKAALAAAVASDKVTLELSAELNQTMVKAKTTARALDKLNDITAEVIGAMATKKKYRWEVSSAVARARSRLYDVKSVLNTTAETDSILSLTLHKLQEEKEIQAAEVLRAAVEAASKAGAQGHDVNELLALLESIEIESKRLPGFESNGTDLDLTEAVTMMRKDAAGVKDSLERDTEGANGGEYHNHGHHGGFGVGEGVDGSDSFNAKEAVPGAAVVAASASAGAFASEAESISDKVASMAKKAAEKAVATEVKAVMAKAETKSDAVVERAAEIARQLALGDLMSQQDPPPDTTAAETSSEEILLQNATFAEEEDGEEEDGVVAAEEEDGSRRSASDEDAADTILPSQRTYVPLLDSNFYRAAKESDAASKESFNGSDKSPPKPSMNWGSEMQKYMTKVKSKLQRLKETTDDQGGITPLDDSEDAKSGNGIVEQHDASDIVGEGVPDGGAG
jgi:hypothetical protein